MTYDIDTDEEYVEMDRAKFEIILLQANLELIKRVNLLLEKLDKDNGNTNRS